MTTDQLRLFLVIARHRSLSRAAAELSLGQVTVSVPGTSGAYLFAPALVAFQREHPNVEVKVRSAHSWDAPGLILDGVAQLALISGPIINPQIESVATFHGRLALGGGQ